ncbi:hypothetical protein [Variovorax sp. PDC80]|uniref:hypothetical protein n=1 Tax=Variovorax sp. PDC80 TaxID=1882827 RepID=UPI00116044D8|nr:hypothetical protein [Variovorax sp. PDC80]
MNHFQPRPRLTGALKVLVISTTLFASIAASAQFAVAGFAIGQEMKSCPDSSVPMRKDARNSGIACRFPEKSRSVFGTSADRLSLATDQRGEVESVLVVGIDAVHAAAKAAEEYGPPDASEVHEKLSFRAWIRGDVRLVIFHHHDAPATSNIILDRYPR